MNNRSSTSSTATSPIPENKKFFKMSEAMEIVGENDSTLRYWEQQFPAYIKPNRSVTHRRYRLKDIELFLQIKHLVRDEQVSLAGVKLRLKQQAIDEKLLHGTINPQDQELREKSQRELILAARNLANEILQLVQ